MFNYSSINFAFGERQGPGVPGLHGGRAINSDKAPPFW
jgi:hypothetical protein